MSYVATTMPGSATTLPARQRPTWMEVKTMQPKHTLVCVQCGGSYYRSRASAFVYCSRACYVADYPTRAAVRFWQFVEKSDDCWLWTGHHQRQGYGTIRVNERYVMAHRFSYELHYGPIPDEMCVCHNCPGGDNPGCVNPAHLWLGTYADNSADMARKGRSVVGSRSPNTRLTEYAVKEIRRRHANGASAAALGREFGVGKSTAHRIVHRKSWTHI